MSVVVEGEGEVSSTEHVWIGNIHQMSLAGAGASNQGVPCLMSREGDLYSEVQCVMGNGHIGAPLPLNRIMAYAHCMGLGPGPGPGREPEWARQKTMLSCLCPCPCPYVMCTVYSVKKKPIIFRSWSQSLSRTVWMSHYRHNWKHYLPASSLAGGTHFKYTNL